MLLKNHKYTLNMPLQNVFKQSCAMTYGNYFDNIAFDPIYEPIVLVNLFSQRLVIKLGHYPARKRKFRNRLNNKEYSFGKNSSVVF